MAVSVSATDGLDCLPMYSAQVCLPSGPIADTVKAATVNAMDPLQCTK